MQAYADKAASDDTAKVLAAQRQAIAADKLGELLANRFGKRLANAIQEMHIIEEDRPIETVWDVVTGATAYARGIPHTDDRIAIERRAGELLAAVAT